MYNSYNILACAAPACGFACRPPDDGTSLGCSRAVRVVTCAGSLCQRAAVSKHVLLLSKVGGCHERHTARVVWQARYENAELRRCQSYIRAAVACAFSCCCYRQYATVDVPTIVAITTAAAALAANAANAVRRLPPL